MRIKEIGGMSSLAPLIRGGQRGGGNQMQHCCNNGEPMF